MEGGSTVYRKLFSLLFYFTLVSTLVVVAAAATNTTRPNRLVFKLIHPNSVISSYYGHHTSISGRAMPHSPYLIANTKGSLTTDDIVGGATSDNLGFLVNISFGDPPVPQLVVMDTGIDLLWVQCRHCNFHQFLTPIYDPFRSSTYLNLSCNSPYCVHSIDGHCDGSNQCAYVARYADDTSSEGTLAIENLTFTTSDEGTTEVSDVVFGCGHHNLNITSKFSGILGLGPHRISLATQLGSKFSYCTGSITDPNYPYNQLILGDGAKIEGYSTPIQVHEGHYYITLEGISVGESRLDIDPYGFKRNGWRSHGAIVDSGATHTFLASGWFEPLGAEVQNLMEGLLNRVQFPKKSDRLCYEGSVSRELKGFPVVTFHFAGGADLVLGVDSIFQQIPVGGDIFCMAVKPSESIGLGDASLIGIMAQQYYNIGYDLTAMKLYFLMIDCELLED